MTIRDAAAADGLTLKDLGRLMGLDRSTLNRWNKQSKSGRLPQYKRDAVNTALRRHRSTDECAKCGELCDDATWPLTGPSPVCGECADAG